MTKNELFDDELFGDKSDFEDEIRRLLQKPFDFEDFKRLHKLEKNMMSNEDCLLYLNYKSKISIYFFWISKKKFLNLVQDLIDQKIIVKNFIEKFINLKKSIELKAASSYDAIAELKDFKILNEKEVNIFDKLLDRIQNKYYRLLVDFDNLKPEYDLTDEEEEVLFFEEELFWDEIHLISEKMKTLLNLS